jgi:hypothetical protein
MLWDLDRVAATMAGTQEFKPNVCIVIVDFMVR